MQNAHVSSTGKSEMVRAKLGYRFSKLTDKLLRKIEDEKDVQGPVGQVLAKLK